MRKIIFGLLFGVLSAAVIVLIVPKNIQAGCASNAECNDGLFCNGIESCNLGTGNCVALSSCPPFIDGCVIRGGACDEINDKCVDVANDSLCDDQDPGTTDTCDLATGECQHSVNCDDGDPCTDDAYNPSSQQCDHTPKTCDDGVFCNGIESCDPMTGNCVALSSCPPFIDGCVIRGGTCDEVNDECVDFADDSLCDDQDPGTTDTCDLATGECLYSPALDCSKAEPSIEILWPPFHRMVPVTIVGVRDSENMPAAITIDSITQDEPVGWILSPDGSGVGTATARLRAERQRKGNGRVYAISFTARDGKGGICQGSVSICVPHDRDSGNNCTDDGQNHDSTVKNRIWNFWK